MSAFPRKRTLSGDHRRRSSAVSVERAEYRDGLISKSVTRAFAARVSWNRRDLCSKYKFWAVRQAIFSVPKSSRRNQRTATEPTALSAWACRQPDNKRSTIAHTHLTASRTPHLFGGSAVASLSH